MLRPQGGRGQSPAFWELAIQREWGSAPAAGPWKGVLGEHSSPEEGTNLSGDNVGDAANNSLVGQA